MRQPNSKRLLTIAAWAAALSLVACGPPAAYVGGGAGSSGNTTTTGGTTADAGAGTPDGGTADAGPPDPACQAGAWNAIALPFFNTYCNSCHAFTSLWAVQQQSGRISSYLQSGTMPPSSHPQPSAAERQEILRWLACGTPQ